MHSAQQLAAQRGWAPSAAWDDIDRDNAPRHPGPDIDEVAVERAMTGQRVPLNAAEQAEAARRLTARGVSLREIAARLHTSIRTASRRRAATAGLTQWTPASATGGNAGAHAHKSRWPALPPNTHARCFLAGRDAGLGRD
ncbi:MAG: hypothetical protein M3P48_10200 [Actinomycetota bacterium]|nr:hypothetical protein [Actinomycetota bacterium]